MDHASKYVYIFLKQLSRMLNRAEKRMERIGMNYKLFQTLLNIFKE